MYFDLLAGSRPGPRGNAAAGSSSRRDCDRAMTGRRPPGAPSPMFDLDPGHRRPGRDDRISTSVASARSRRRCRRVDQPGRRLPPQDLAPLEFSTVRGPLVDPPTGPRFEVDLEVRLACRGVVGQRPPSTDLRGPDIEGVVSRGLDVEGGVQRLDHGRRAPVFSATRLNGSPRRPRPARGRRGPRQDPPRGVRRSDACHVASRARSRPRATRAGAATPRAARSAARWRGRRRTGLARQAAAGSPGGWDRPGLRMGRPDRVDRPPAAHSVTCWLP